MNTSELANGAVTNAKIAERAVDGAKIADGSVGTADIADGTIATVDLDDDAVTAQKIGPGAVIAGKIGPGAVGNNQLADNAVNSAKIADGGVTGTDIADGSIATDHIGDRQVTRAKAAPDMLLPVAYGVVNADGTCPPAQRTSNVSCRKLTGTAGRYEVTISGLISPYVAVVTAVHSTEFATATIESTSGPLVVRTRNDDSHANNVDRPFHFVVFKP